MMKTITPNTKSPLNILVIQERGHHDENRNFRESLCLQRAFQSLSHSCDVWGKGHSNFGNIPDFESYDIIVNLENYGDDWLPDLSKTTRPRKLIWCIDAHVRGEGVYEQIQRRGKYHILAHATPKFVKPDNGEGFRSVWLPNCVDTEIIYQMNDVQKVHTFGFCGNYVTPQRRVAVDTMTSIFGLKRDIFVIGHSMVRAINSYKIHFNMNISVDINYRNFETMACGTVLFTSENPANESLGFINGVNCFTHDGTIDGIIRTATPLYEMAKANDSRLTQVANEGRSLVLQRHTYVSRATQILNNLGF